MSPEEEALAEKVARVIRDAALEEAAKVARKQFAEGGWHIFYKEAGRIIARNIAALRSGEVGDG